MRQSESFNGKIGGRLIAVAVLTTVATILFSYQRATSTMALEPQAPRQQRTRPKPKRGTQTQVKTAPRFTGFTHESHRAPISKLNCSDCHTIPSREAPDEVAAATKASIKGYPYHDSCTDCHRRTPPQFFRGATPSICTVCHTRSSPRLTARDMSPFPKQNKQAMELEFPGYFPHNHAGHKRPGCETCHMADQRADVAVPVGVSEASYKPTAGTFKTSPSGHAACFECHWQKDKPTAHDCAGCHLPPAEVAKEPRNQLSANAREWFKSWPLEWPKRISLKFNHGSKEHYETDCTDCHTNTREMNTLDSPKAEVKIAACVTCHFKSAPNIGKEMFDEDTEDTAEGRNNSSSSKAGKHTCTGCHTNVIGSTPPPCSHFLVGDKYLSLEDYSENAGRIAERCKKNEQ